MLRGGCKSWGLPDLEATETKRGSDRNEARKRTERKREKRKTGACYALCGPEAFFLAWHLA
jgi:hypothetical protein